MIPELVVRVVVMFWRSSKTRCQSSLDCGQVKRMDPGRLPCGRKYGRLVSLSVCQQSRSQ